ncbi:heavy metal translocating P-type ATPase [Lyngbya aestuarii]|uniref:heavy metal translocating P-type ATPase n=1 Tax=Lyngbya aestuarii TaxID=118322 RepID=UPI00403D56BA
MTNVAVHFNDVSRRSTKKLREKSTTFTGIAYQAGRLSQVSCSIVNATPGRVRFRVPRLVHDLEYTQRLKMLLAADSHVTSIRFKRAASSVVIRYLPGTMADALVHFHFAQLIQQASEVLVSVPSKGASTQKPSARDTEQASSWAGLKLPALVSTLSLLGGPLGLSIPPAIIGGSIALAAMPVARRALNSIIRQRRLNVDCLDLTAISLMTAQSHFITSSTMITMIQLGEAIRSRTARSSKNQTLDLLSSLAQFVWVEREGEKQQIPLEEVELGDTVIVYPGEQIPVDGHILRGKAMIDEQKLTGESMPVVRTQGETVYASTLVRDGQLYILVEQTGANTRAGRTLQLIQDVPVHDTRVENYAAKIADRAVIPTLLLGGAVFAATGNIARAASVLTLDFATGIRVSVPTTVMAALSAAARRGILIRSGRALEKLALVNAVVFDKTGTLTQGDVAIIGIKTPDPSISPLCVLKLAAAAEQRITHPVALAIMRHANYHELIVPSRGEWEYQVGLGIRAEIEGQHVLVGSERFLLKEGVSLERLYQSHPDLKITGYPAIYVASNGEVLGVIQYTDPLRPESREVLTVLKQEIGADIHMLTGDIQQRAQTVARELDIKPTHVHAEAFPEQKAEIIQRLHNEGRTVAFVGDGLNDSAALAYADVSVSFRDGSEVARETADVVLMNNDLRGLLEAIAIARNAKKIIHQNTSIIAIPNISGLAIAATFGLNPMAANLINNGSSVIAGANGLRPMLNAHKD